MPRPFAVAQQHRAGVTPVPHQRARVDLPERDEVELQRGDDAEAPSAAAQRPEQVRVVLVVGADMLAAGGHELDRGHVVGLQPITARQPRQPASERVLDDTDVRRGAGEADQAVLGGARRHVLPQRAGADARKPPPRVDAHAAHRPGPEEDGVVQPAERGGVVPGRLWRHPQPELARGEDDGDHVVLALGKGDCGGMLVHVEVPWTARIVPTRIARGEQRAAEASAQVAQVGNQVDGHRNLLVSAWSWSRTGWTHAGPAAIPLLWCPYATAPPT